MKKIILFGIVCAFFTSLQAQDLRYSVPPSGSDGTDLFAEPDILNPNILCALERGSQLNYLDEKQKTGLLEFAKVEVLSGSCVDQVGWVSLLHLSITEP